MGVDRFDRFNDEKVARLEREREGLVSLATRLGASEGQIARVVGDRIDVRRIQDEVGSLEARQEIEALNERFADYLVRLRVAIGDGDADSDADEIVAWIARMTREHTAETERADWMKAELLSTAEDLDPDRLGRTTFAAFELARGKTVILGPGGAWEALTESERAYWIAAAEEAGAHVARRISRRQCREAHEALEADRTASHLVIAGLRERVAKLEADLKDRPPITRADAELWYSYRSDVFPANADETAAIRRVEAALVEFAEAGR